MSKKFKMLPKIEKYKLLTGDPAIIKEIGEANPAGILTLKMLEITGVESVEEIGLLGQFMLYDKEDKNQQMKIISIFNREVIEETKAGFMNEQIVRFPKLEKLYKYFYMEDSPEGLINYTLDDIYIKDIVKKSDLKARGLRYDDIVAFQWHIDLTLCTILDISLLDPELNIYAEPLAIGAHGEKSKRQSRLAVFVVECTHRAMLENEDMDLPYKVYDPEEVLEFFKRRAQ